MAKRHRRFRRGIATLAVAAVGVAAVWALSCRPPGPATPAPAGLTTPEGRPRPVRVLLVRTSGRVRLAVRGPYTISTLENPGRRLASGAAMPPTDAYATDHALVVGRRHFPDSELELSAEREGAIEVNGRRYRGKMVLRRDGARGLAVVNVLGLDAYLYGVLASEVYPSWPAAALEAQAIVARSYAMWRMAQRREKAYDLVATSADQNYRGMANEDPRIRAAVDRTAGVVLLFHMRLFRCYYHSTCGGQTEAVENFFPEPPLLPLSGVPCGYCKGSKFYRWRREFTARELADALRRAGYSVPTLQAIELGRRSASGRVLEVRLQVGGGRWITLRAGRFRRAIGGRRLPSTLFTVRRTARGFVFEGRGFGHGVGLCQWGARGMAKAGWSASEILRHYYPGAELVRLYKGRDSV